MLEQERQRIEQLTAGWDDPTQVDWGAEEDQTGDEARAEAVKSVPGLKCTALYSYTVSISQIFSTSRLFMFIPGVITSPFH